MGYQATRALGDGPDAAKAGVMPGAMLPRRLQPLSSPTGLGAIPELNKGKGPSSGRPTVKKSPHASSEEDVSGAEGSGTALAPPFSPTRPLAPIGTAPALPPIGGAAASGRLPTIRRPPANLNLKDLPNPLGPRRTSTDPFSSEPLSPIQPAVSLSPIQSLPPRPSVVQIPKKTADKDT